MDSSDATAISSTTNQLYFKGPYRRQNWSFPDSIIYYISKNPKSPKLYQKLIQSCKYFFSKNSIIVCSSFYAKKIKSQIKIEIEQDGEKKYILLKDFSQSFWITNNIFISAEETGQRNLISSLIPNIYQCDIKDITIEYQTVSFNELLFLASKATKIWLSRCTIKDEEKSVVFVEKIIETFVQTKRFYFEFNENDPSISSKTIENLIKIPHFSSIDSILFGRISEVFDIETFYVYMKKNKHTRFFLSFGDSISDAYGNRLEEIVNEILETENHHYKPPMFNFNGLSYEQFDKLRQLNINME